MGAVTRFLKRCAVSGTSFARNYREDLFYRTTVTVIVLETGFALFLLALVAIGGTILYQQILTTVTEAIRVSLTTGITPGETMMLASTLEYSRSSIIVIIATLILIGSAIFGYLIAHLALKPTRQALEIQKQFVANVAHEIRTPLSIIKTNAEVGLFSEPEGTPTRALLETSIEELDRISEIINNLLSLSAVVRSQRMRFTGVPLSGSIRAAIDSLAPFAQRRRIVIEYAESENPLVWGNPAALEQIVTNLLKNALLYSREAGPAVRISAVTKGKHVELVIEDEGAGIHEKDLAHILEPFYRGDPSRTRRAAGAGLGLTIVNELLKMHSGSMRIKSVLGRGTTVTVTFPKARGDQTPATHAPLKDEVSIDFSTSPS